MCPKQQHHHPSIPKLLRPNRRALQDPSNFLTFHQHPNISYRQPSTVHQYSTQKKTHHTYLGPQPITPIYVQIRTTPILLRLRGHRRLVGTVLWAVHILIAKTAKLLRIVSICQSPGPSCLGLTALDEGPTARGGRSGACGRVLTVVVVDKYISITFTMVSRLLSPSAIF